MFLTELRIRNLRNIDDQQIELASGLNAFIGPNGAGKTSVLEAAHLLSHGASFRTHQIEHIQQRGSDEVALFAQLQCRVQNRRIGLLRKAGRWTAKVDGDASTSLTDLFSVCAVVCFEPGSHALIAGPAELRRGFLDWGVFHVEHGIAADMRRYRRALRQRNALLKQDASETELLLWDQELASAGEPLATARDAYMERFAAALMPLLSAYLPELGTATLKFQPGWDRNIALTTALAEAHQRDRRVGHTTRGPHRADWSIGFAFAPAAEQLSRGQEKLCAIACVLAQSRLFHAARHEWPIIALDDLCSELDAPHQHTALAALIDSGAQILLTGTDIPPALLERFAPRRLFHVEQGKVQAVL